MQTANISESRVADELSSEPFEPFLPAETSLIGWSVGLGVVLLAIFILVSHL